MNFLPRKGVPSSALKMGGTAVEVKIWIKPKESSVPPFSHYSQVFTRVEGGIGGPNPPAGALGSPVKTSPNLLSRKSQTSILVSVFTITFA